MSDEEKGRAPTTQELAKFEAETAKILAETEAARQMAELNKVKGELENKKLAAEMAKIEEETRTAHTAAEANLINLHQMQRQEEAALAADLFHGVYFFTDDVSEKSVHNCMERLNYWRRTRPNCDIEIIFSSPGGSVFDGFTLFDYIQELKRAGHRVTTGTLGMAASMAGILLQAGSTRYAGKEAWVLIHEISTLAWDKSSLIEDEVAFMKRIQERVIDIFLDGNQRGLASGTATKRISQAQFEKNWKRKDWWLTAEECLAYGFIDAIR